VGFGGVVVVGAAVEAVAVVVGFDVGAVHFFVVGAVVVADAVAVAVADSVVVGGAVAVVVAAAVFVALAGVEPVVVALAVGFAVWVEPPEAEVVPASFPALCVKITMPTTTAISASPPSTRPRPFFGCAGSCGTEAVDARAIAPE
jgi:hypothetical protein